MKINKYNLYDILVTNLLKLVDEDWSSNNDAKFANPNKLEKKLNNQLHAIEKNLLQSGIGKKTYELIKEKILAKNAKNDSDLTFNSIFDHINFSKDE